MDREAIQTAYTRVKERYNLPFDLKKEQENALIAILNKKSTFVLLPTGFGKSYVFILPPLLLDEIEPNLPPHITLVVSPLRSLMINQVHNLQKVGIKACAVLQLSEMQKEDINGILAGEFSIVFISPESCDLDPWRKMFKQTNYKQQLVLVACDEAHCISQWGLDFRPKYRNVAMLRSLCSYSPFCMLTATCSEEMKAEILECLLLKDSDVVTIAVVPDRPNIFLNFSSKPAMNFEEELSWYLKLLMEQGKDAPKAIIYCRKIGDVSDIFEHFMFNLMEKAWCGDASVSNRIIEMYHSSISKGSEQRVLNEFPKTSSTIRCIISTIAFGMGVQIPDIDMVIHWGASKSVLSYMQEIGRCARDGRKGEAFLYAYARSLDKRRTNEDMLELCKSLKGESVSCMRVNLLERLTFQGMDLSCLRSMEERQKCSTNCDSCECVFCSCCCICKRECPCNGTL